jgi:excisionase family DNA binding protein
VEGAHTSGGALTPLLFNVRDAARLLGLGRSKFYELLSTGEVRTVRVGRRRLVPADALTEYVARLTADHGDVERDQASRGN